MSCPEVEAELVGYHFAVLDEPARARVESHLVVCNKCCATLVALKRAIEIDDASAPRPSAEARARLRHAVAVELGIAPAARRSWERPLAFALAACTVLALGFATRAVTAGPGSPPYALSHSGR